MEISEGMLNADSIRVVVAFESTPKGNTEIIFIMLASVLQRFAENRKVALNSFSLRCLAFAHYFRCVWRASLGTRLRRGGF